jgi:hypothetical protein
MPRGYHDNHVGVPWKQIHIKSLPPDLKETADQLHVLWHSRKNGKAEEFKQYKELFRQQLNEVARKEHDTVIVVLMTGCDVILAARVPIKKAKEFFDL